MKTNPYKDLLVNRNIKIPLPNGEMVTPIDFDNAATTPPFKSALKAINEFAPFYGSIHRGAGYKSRITTQRFEETRRLILDFVGADPNTHTVIYVKNATEALNKVAYRFYKLYNDFVVLSSEMEHHSNDLPWRDKCIVDYIAVDEKGVLNLDSLIGLLKKYQGKVKLVTITGVSNVTGHINPIHKIAEIAHEYGAEILVDGSQMVPHMPVSMQSINSKHHIDYLVFSAHKMYAPFGIGVLVGLTTTLTQSYSEIVGGGTVKFVSRQGVIWDAPPNKEEAGTPNFFGVLALQQAIITLKKMGLSHIFAYEKELTRYAFEKLKALPSMIFYGDMDHLENRIGVITFNIQDVPHQIVAEVLALEGGISVRNGCFCAQPYLQKLFSSSPTPVFTQTPFATFPGMVRISFGFHNEKREIDVLISVLLKMILNKKYYINKYQYALFQ